MHFSKAGLWRCVLILCILICGSHAMAQVKADLAADIISGCSPLTVSFTNKSTGGSAGTKYEWDLGNGQTSDKVDAKAVYTVAKTYTITLKATDGAQTDSKSITIIVYQNPTPDFTATPLKVCAPSDIQFTSTSTPGDGTITNYFWDFGDGNTAEGATQEQVTHKYTFGQKPPLRLTVTNSHGCFATAEKKDLIEITPGIRINFAAAKTTLCSLQETVVLTNTTTGPGTLSYEWDFGDGRTSTEKVPAPFTYDKKGQYTIQLKVSNTEGCTNTLSRTGYINAANWESGFSLPAPLCDRQSLLFSSTSKPAPAQSLWKFSDNNSTQSGTNVQHAFAGPGAYSVQLINTYGACLDTVTQQVAISSSPRLDGFLLDPAVGCQAPHKVQFEDTATNIATRKWSFGTGATADTSADQKPEFTFDRLGNFGVTLAVTNNAGCTSSILKYVNINRPQVYIGYTKSSSPSGNLGCPGMSVQFKAFPEGQIKEYEWDFGDGGTAMDAEPTHAFEGEGNFTIKLKYLTNGGCRDSVIATNYVRTYRKPKVDFESQSGLTICGNSPVQFKDLSDTATRWLWDFGDGASSTQQNPVHSYGRQGDFTVTLVATNQYCSDTVVKSQFIKLVPPFTDITGLTKDCKQRGQVKLTQTTDGATKWEWDFGDGSPVDSYTDNKGEVTHTYTKSGVYKIVLAASNATCTAIDTIHVSVLVKQKPELTLDKTSLCGNDTLTYTIRMQDTIKWYYNWDQKVYSYPYSGYLEYSNGTYHSSTTSGFYPLEYSQRLTNFRPGVDSLRLITYDGINRCYDTSNFVSVSISGPSAGFTMNSRAFCMNTGVTFTDTSKSTGGVPIKQWIWDFGDNRRDTLDASISFSRKYTGAGLYYPRLKVIDANGCSAETAQFGSYLYSYGPDVDFYTQDSVVQPNSSVQFYNTTNAWPFYPITYTWNFGDGSPPSTAVNPAHVYTASGDYTVTLIAKSTYGCTDTLVRRAYVRVKTIRAQFSFTAAYVNNNSCPPLLARFTSNSVNADSIFWDFGDLSYADNDPTPRHTYYQPGVYRVTLYAFGQNSIDSVSQEITVNGPYGTVVPSELTGCSPKQITLTADARNTSTFTWDFNDGYVAQDKDTAAVHVYTKAGVYHPKIILRDASGCTSTILLQDSIIIDRLETSFSPSQRLICDSGMVSFAPSLQSFAADSLKVPPQLRWQFGTGNGADSSVAAQPVFNYTVLGDYPVSLETTSAYGCAQTKWDTIRVLPKPKATIQSIASACVNMPVSVLDTSGRTTGESWRWQFGDGRSSEAENPGTIAFDKPGRYQLSLFKSSINGCSDTAYHPVIIDQLTAQVSLDKKLVCDSGMVSFAPTLRSYAADSLQAQLVYKWQLVNQTVLDTAIAATGRFRVNLPENYRVQLAVNSPYGCTANAEDSVRVLQTPQASIEAADAVCAGGTVQFTGGISEQAGTVWAWSFPADRSETQNPQKQFNTAGSYTISLVAYNHPACPDTVQTKLVVHPLPQIALAPKDSVICRFDSFTLQANDAVQYEWAVQGIAQPGNSATLRVSPEKDTRYQIKATNQFGCFAEDEAFIRVSQPFTVTAFADKDSICANRTVGLHASGAVSYQWTPTTVNDPRIAEPIAKPAATTSYTVVGYGADQCFTDTAIVRVAVVPLPQVNAGNDTMVLWRHPAPLVARTSADVTQLLWTPATFLNCFNCNSPISTPERPVEYRVIAKNSFGCVAVDTVFVGLLCSSNAIFIPNAFTPDDDGLNDVFYVKGGGVRLIKFFRVFNRWGHLVFEKKDISINDRNAAWDGMLNGEKLPGENYVYITEMICEENKTFQMKGIVTLIR